MEAQTDFAWVPQALLLHDRRETERGAAQPGELTGLSRAPATSVSGSRLKHAIAMVNRALMTVPRGAELQHALYTSVIASKVCLRHLIF